MRASLQHSLADSPSQAGESFRYPKGAIVLCNTCARPMAKLDHGIGVGDKGGRMVNAFTPLTVADLRDLAVREDIDAGVRVWARRLTPEDQRRHVAQLVTFRTGDPMLCPLCKGCFVQVLAVERDAVLDRAYVIELVTLPPSGQRAVRVRGKRLGAHAEWIHEGAKGVR